ncbi:MAG: hypothetical protein IKU37_06835 [Candidatus Gastranaerophilales bacterium]|nr:hypothetical protein [Candidatus Gastranaerophilales bacterium]
MATISPLLQNRINSTGDKKQAPNNRHEKIYQDLQKRAHEARPNEAKAKMVNEGILGNPITDTIDTAKDGKNFFKAVTTGNLGDNNLGRINDLGLKVGAGLIASFLALHAKTKTQSIMSFIGGATFVAMMDLWPKLFINLPARLVHGFRIDRKYISAQGDKKDFFLDNQFLVWDAYPEEQLRKDAKKAGIDYDSENGKEKIQRKMQKTALQNRTLWMATAGFATPLLTSMVGNRVQPLVEEAVVKHGVKKTQNVLNNGLGNYLKNAKAASSNLGGLFEKYQEASLNDDFYIQLGDLLNPTAYLQKFKDNDDAVPLGEWKVQGLIDELKEAYKEFVIYDKEDLKSKLAALETLSSGSVTDGVMSFKSGSLDANKIAEALEKLGDKNPTLKEVEEIFVELALQNDQKEDILKRAKLIDDGKKSFFEFIQKLDDKLVAPLKARSKAYLDLINPVVGSKAESRYTLEYGKTLSKLLKTLGLDKLKNLRKLKSAHTDQFTDTIVNQISEAIQRAIVACGDDEEKYKAFIQSLGSEPISDEIVGIVGQLEGGISKENLMLEIGDEIDGVNIKGFKNALIGGSDNDEGLIRLLKNFIERKKIDLDATKSKAIICANFERRVLAGEFDDLKERLNEFRKILYDGTISNAANRNYMQIPAEYHEYANRLFNESKFSVEENTLGNAFKNALDNVRKIFTSVKDFKAGTAIDGAAKDYMACGSLVQNMKNAATRLSNDKTWMKIFAPMTIALIAITLLVQPLFGKIDKEFPEEGNGGAK